MNLAAFLPAISAETQQRQKLPKSLLDINFLLCN